MTLKNENFNFSFKEETKTGIETIFELIDDNKLNLEKIQLVLEKEGLDYDDAKEVIEYFYNKGERPSITVPVEYSESKKESGFKPKKDWERESEIIAGTFLINVYNTENEDRDIFKINIPLEKIKPRLTGRDGKFHGVVFFDECIKPEDIELIK